MKLGYPSCAVRFDALCTLMGGGVGLLLGQGRMLFLLQLLCCACAAASISCVPPGLLCMCCRCLTAMRATVLRMASMLQGCSTKNVFEVLFLTAFGWSLSASSRAIAL